MLDPTVVGAGLIGLLVGFVVLRNARRRRTTLAAVILVCVVSLGIRPAVTHEGEDHNDATPSLPSSGGDLAQRLPDGTIFVPKSIQRIFGIRSELTDSPLTAAPRSCRVGLFPILASVDTCRQPSVGGWRRRQAASRALELR